MVGTKEQAPGVGAEIDIAQTAQRLEALASPSARLMNEAKRLKLFAGNPDTRPVVTDLAK